jgi:hypothetical protein
VKVGVVCKELRWQSAALNREGKVPQFKGQSSKGMLVPNPSFERTASSGLRPLPAAAQLERWAPVRVRLSYATGRIQREVPSPRFAACTAAYFNGLPVPSGHPLLAAFTGPFATVGR